MQLVMDDSTEWSLVVAVETKDDSCSQDMAQILVFKIT